MTTDAYTAEYTALLIVDPYNDFMSEGGKLYTAFKETADEPGSFLTLYQTAHSESIVDKWDNFALGPRWSAA
jgi:hypothetical protein